MKPRSFLFLALIGVSSFLLFVSPATGTERKWKELPLLTTEERTYWPLSLGEREKLVREGKPLPAVRTSYMLTDPDGPALRNPFPEIFRYWVWMSRHPDTEPVGIVFRPDEDIPPISDEDYLRFRIQNLRGKTVPLYQVARQLSMVSERFVLLSARAERRLVSEYKLAGTQVETVERLRRELAKQGVSVLEMGIDSYIIVEAPERRSPFPFDRSRAAEFQRDRELWFQKRPGYHSRGLIYQPLRPSTTDGDATELRVEGPLVRHLAAALATFTQKEVFVQAAVEKNKFKSPVLRGSREEVLKQLKRPLDHSDVRLFEFGPDSLGLVVE